MLKQLKAQILEVRAQVLLLNSLLAKACDYALNQWEKLEVYAHHREVEIDNNWCENAMRPVAVAGRAGCILEVMRAGRRWWQS